MTIKNNKEFELNYNKLNTGDRRLLLDAWQTAILWNRNIIEQVRSIYIGFFIGFLTLGFTVIGFLYTIEGDTASFREVIAWFSFFSISLCSLEYTSFYRFKKGREAAILRLTKQFSELFKIHFKYTRKK